MIRCNLRALAAERNITLTKISVDTGISRTTLTSLARNNAQGIQFETLNTLCNYLSVSPNNLFIHIPIELSVHFHYGRYTIFDLVKDPDPQMIMEIQIKDYTNGFPPKSEELNFAVKPLFEFNDDNKIVDIDLFISITPDDANKRTARLFDTGYSNWLYLRTLVVNEIMLLFKEFYEDDSVDGVAQWDFSPY